MPPGADELASRHPNVPALRLRGDTPSVEIDETTPVNAVIEQLESTDVAAIAVREHGAEATAIVLPVERYLELAGRELGYYARRVAVDGRMVPEQSALAASYVEQVDPRDGWAHGDAIV